MKKGAVLIMKLTEKENAKLLKIAMKHFSAVEDRKSLATKDNDHEDFFEVSVWGLKAALEEAYNSGMKEGMKK